MAQATVHKPVMLGEVLELLDVHSGGVYVDATLGGGSHSMAILDAGGRVVAIDCDADAVERAHERFSKLEGKIRIFHANFEEIDSVMDEAGVELADGILADLGISSDQLEDAQRGFSFSKPGPVDMRMDTSRGENLASFLGRVSERELADVIFRLGEERYSRKIAAAIKKAWRNKLITDTVKLAEVVALAVPPAARRGRIHPATRTFQALRKYINREQEVLQRFLEAAILRLKSGGRLVVISFESGEDRIVKQYFRRFSAEGLGEVITKKPITPSKEEISENPRARSAKVRAFRRA